MSARSSLQLDQEHLGRALAAARRLAGFRSRSQLASYLNELGIKTSTRSIQNYELGRSLPNLRVFYAIARLATVPDDWGFFLHSTEASA